VDNTTSGVEPEMRVMGAMIVSWIIQCDQGVRNKQRRKLCMSGLVCMSVDSQALRCSVLGTSFEERLEDCLWILKIIVDYIDEA